MADFLYSDLNHFNPSEKPLITDQEAIAQGLELIFSSISPQRAFRPEFPGESLDTALFDEVTSDGAISVFRIAKNLVENWQPSVILNTQRSSVIAEPDMSRYRITLTYNIRGMEGTEFQQVGFINRT